MRTTGNSSPPVLIQLHVERTVSAIWGHIIGTCCLKRLSVDNLNIF